MSVPIVAIVGRPNVGKSTLFNKIIGKRMAIVDDTPGVTRDGVFCYSEWNKKEFMLVDTGGFEKNAKDNDILCKVNAKTIDYVKMAAAVIFMVDVRSGIVSSDIEFASILKKIGTPVFLCVNKCDSIGNAPFGFYEFYELFQENVFSVSAIHGHGVGDLLDAVVGGFKYCVDKANEEAIRVAIVGKPNVGKSSLINKILGEDRLIVSEISGTTRDAVDVFLQVNGKDYIFIDTAGVRKKSKIVESVERYSVIRTFMAVDRADVCVLVVDALDGAAEQDLKIAGYINKKGKAVIVAVNKWDVVEKDSHVMANYTEKLKKHFSFIIYAPYIFISAITGQRLDKLFNLIEVVNSENNKRLSTGMLNELLSYSISKAPPPSFKGRKLKIYYITQACCKPPTFVLFVNDKNLFHFSYKRYLENNIRKEFKFIGVPLRFLVRERK